MFNGIISSRPPAEGVSEVALVCGALLGLVAACAHHRATQIRAAEKMFSGRALASLGIRETGEIPCSCPPPGVDPSPGPGPKEPPSAPPIDDTGGGTRPPFKSPCAGCLCPVS